MLFADFQHKYAFENLALQSYYKSWSFWYASPPQHVVRPSTYDSVPGNYPSIEPPYLPLGVALTTPLILLMMVDALLLLLGRNWWVIGGSRQLWTWVVAQLQSLSQRRNA
jgi:hypothetical protein